MSIRIYHNPRCSTSCNVLALLTERGLKPQVIEYLKTPMDAPALRVLVEATGKPLRQLVRSKEPVYDELGLTDADDFTLLDAMVKHPVLINRPIVVTSKGAALCRPPELVLELLD